jgi:hypothetical protein
MTTRGAVILAVLVTAFGVGIAVFVKRSFQRGFEEIGRSQRGDTGAGDEDSLIRPANFAQVLDRARAQTGPRARVRLLRLDGSRAVLDVHFDGREQGMVIERGGKLTPFPAIPSGVLGAGVALATMRPGDPLRVITAAGRRNPDFNLAEVNYMVLSDNSVGEGPGWNVYFGPPGAGTFITSDYDGTRILEPSRSGSRPVAPVDTTPAGPESERARRISQCIQRAGSDVERIRACEKA